MAETNADRFTDAMTAFNDRDAERLFAHLDPGIEWQPRQTALQGDLHGHDGVTRWITDLVEVYEDGRVDLTDVRDLGDQVLALGTLSFTGRGSGIKTEAPVAIVATFSGGLIVRCTDYGDEREARAAVGLTD
jgi:ketosteroid isomerase-like protein